MADMQWKKAPAFHEIAEALGCETVDIMAALVTPTGIMAMFTPVPADDDPMIFSAMLNRDADDILVAGPRREVESTSSFMRTMNVQIGARLEEEFGPPPGHSVKVEIDEISEGPDWRGVIPPYDVEPDDEDPEQPDV